MSDVPSEVLVGILSRLPVKSLLRFRSVSKPLCALIDSPYFVNLHRKQSINTGKVISLFEDDCFSYSFRSICLDPHPTNVQLITPFANSSFCHVLGSCHGLICLSCNPFDSVILLWNPSTRKYKFIQTTNHYPSSCTSTVVINQVGYDHVNDDYKVVKLSQFVSSGMNYTVWLDSKFSVYSLKLNAWQSVEQGFPYKFLLQPSPGQGVCVSGASHWLINQKPNPDNDYLIVAFDFVSQNFELVPQPEYSDKYVAADLGVLGGCLCVIGGREMWNVDVWVMGEYGVKESWSKLVVLSMKNEMTGPYLIVRPLMYLNNGKEVLLEINSQSFMIYDLKEKKSKQKWFWDVFPMSTVVYQESLDCLV